MSKSHDVFFKKKNDVLILDFIYFCFLKICFEWSKELWVCEVKLYIISSSFKCKKTTQKNHKEDKCSQS